MSVVAVLCIIYGIKHTAEVGPELMAAVVMLIGIAVGYLFIRREEQQADPLIDVKLFKTPAFSAALATNMLGLFMMLGAFFFITQYLQLVLRMGPLEAGLWMAPSGIVFALGSLAAPYLVRRFRPGYVISCGLLLASLGFALLTQIAGLHTPWLLFAGMMIFCAGMSPTGAITTDIVMSAAPPERAGAASAISETSFELGGASGIAVLGSLFTFVYGRTMDAAHLTVVPEQSIAVARGTLSGAIEVAKALPAAEAATLMDTARGAFVYGFEVASAVSAMFAVLAAIFAFYFLRNARAAPSSH